MSTELEAKIEKYKKAMLASQSEVEKAQYSQLVKELEAQRPSPTIRVILTEQACDGCA